jgi:hypothetical protein
MRASWVWFGGALLLCAVGCGSATLSQDGGTDAAAGTTGHAGGSGGHGAGGGGTTGAGGSGLRGGAGGPSSTGSGGTLGTGGTSSQGGAGGNGAAGVGGVGGSLGMGGSSAAGTAGHGQGGAGAAGTSGSGGASGAGGTSTCTNTTSDAANCGSCGHSCLGGTCATGICQPFLLGTLPVSGDQADYTTVSVGKVYVFTQVTQGTATNVWQLDASNPSTPTEVLTTGSPPSCVMNGELFWIAYNGSSSPETIDACTASSCTSTTQPIVTLDEQIATFPGCDTVNDEIVWTTLSSNGSTLTIHRASPSGANARGLTSVNFPSDGASWQVVNNGYLLGETDRIFYARNDSASSSASLYYISTDVVNAAGVLVFTASTAQIFATGELPVLANDTIVLASGRSTSSSAYEVFSAPLPNGIISGAPPVFTPGQIAGVIDQSSFYGTIFGSSVVPSDAVVKCQLSNCAAPTIIVRGQSNAKTFTDDNTAIYWTTASTLSTQGFSVWKAAK